MNPTALPETDTRPISDDDVFDAHKGGKLEVSSRIPLNTVRNLSIAYTPGVAAVSMAIHENPELHRELTWAGRLVVVVSNGTAVLGLGNIGAAASMPVMEGKSALIRELSGLNSIPLVINSNDVDEVIDTLVALRPSYGAINLEDFAAPMCFELERRLIEAVDCPVMHDDQHGTAVVMLAGLINATRSLERDITAERVVIVGSGAAGVACAKILLSRGVNDIVMVDSRGVISSARTDLDEVKRELLSLTNPRGVTGGLAEALEGATTFIGVSRASIGPETLARMAARPIVFSMANPTPEVSPQTAAQIAAIYATGRSDLPNQINNVLAFPGIFRGALDAGATRITERMKLAAADAIALLVSPEQLAQGRIVPAPLDPRVCPAVAAAVSAAC